jgi:2-iminobutanoate/2-iminopropanoate deaminase
MMAQFEGVNTVHRISSPKLFSEDALFPPGVRAGELTFVATDARDATGQIHRDTGATSQARRSLYNLSTALGEVGQNMENLVSLWVLLTHYDDCDAVLRVLNEYFPEPSRAYPAVTVLGGAKLEAGCNLRMDAIASVSPNRGQLRVGEVPLAPGVRGHGVRSGDLYFLSGVDGSEQGAVGEDLYEAMSRQVNAILDRTVVILGSEGLSLSDVFRNHNFLCRMADPKTKDAHRDTRLKRLGSVFKPEEFPAQTRIGVSSLGKNVFQRSIFIATSHKGKKYVSSDKVRLTPGIFSQSVRVGDWLFVAGQDSIGLDQQTIGANDLAVQTNECLMHIKDIVEAAGAGLEDVVKTTVYLLDGQDRSLCMSTYRKFFTTQFTNHCMPTGLTIGIEDLHPGCLVEVDAVAYLGAR